MVALSGLFACWLIGWALFWRVPVVRRVTSAPDWPVSVVVPVRDEEATIGRLLASLSRQTRPPHEVIVVDDHSTDGTAAVARAAGAIVVASEPLPAGWTGKPWACWQGAQRATGRMLLFLDADTWLEPDGGPGLVAAYAERPGLLSVQPYHDMVEPSERLGALFNLITMMGFGAFTILGDRVPARAAFGPCLLAARDDYFAVGGHGVAAGAVLEGLPIGEAFAEAGHPVRCLAGRGTVSFRMYPDGVRSMVDGFAKGFATGAGTVRPWVLAAVVLWMVGAVSTTRHLAMSLAGFDAQPVAVGGAGGPLRPAAAWHVVPHRQLRLVAGRLLPDPGRLLHRRVLPVALPYRGPRAGRVEGPVGAFDVSGLRIVDLPTGWTILLDIAVWFVIHMGVVFVMVSVPVSPLRPARMALPPAALGGGRATATNGLPRTSLEREPARCCGVDAPRQLSEAPTWQDGATPYLERFARETCRAEVTHLLTMLWAPVFFLWNPVWVGWLMIALRARRERTACRRAALQPATHRSGARSAGAPARDPDGRASAMIDVDGLRVAYGERLAVDDVTLRVAPGEFFGLLGPNGAGKTSVLAALCGLIAAHGGARRHRRARPVARTNTRGAAARAGAAGTRLLPGADGPPEPRLLRACARAPGRRAARRRRPRARPGAARRPGRRPGAHLLGRHEAPPERRDRAPARARGPRARRADGRASMRRAATPCSSASRRSRAAGTTVLYTTHLMEEAERLCDRVAIMDGGRLVAEDAPAALIGRHGSGALRVDFDRPAARPLARRSRRRGTGPRGARATGPGSSLVAERPERMLAVLPERAAAAGLRPSNRSS